MIFSDPPQQRALERMMTAVPRFRPKGGGIMVLHYFEYTAEMCDCRYCPYYRGKRKCTASQCLCIGERIAAGAASRAEVMAETVKDIHNAAFRRRLNLYLIAFAYCVIKIFFQNIKRGGILLVQMAVGSLLYMFSVPRGYADGFNQWCKQVAAICLASFMQTTLLFLGLLTFPDHMLTGLGIMLAANEMPRIARQFGLDSSVKVDMMSVIHATATAVNLTRSFTRATGK